MIKLSKLFEGCIKEHDDKADSVLTVILKEDGDSQVIIAGVDELMIGKKAVVLARILSDILQTKLNKAYHIAESIDKDEKLVHARETERPISEVSEEDEDEDLCDDIKFVLEKLAHSLLDIIGD